MSKEEKVEEIEEETPETEEIEEISSPDDDFDKDRALATIKKLRSEIKGLKPRLKRVEELEALEADRKKAEEARKEAEMTEAEKLKGQLEEERTKAERAEQRAREMLIRAEFAAEAAKQGMSDPSDAYILADKSEVDVNDLGAVEGVTEAIKDLIATKPYLIGKRQAPSVDGGAGSTERSKTIEKLTTEEIQIARKMGLTPEQYAQSKKAASTQEIDERDAEIIRLRERLEALTKAQ